MGHRRPHARWGEKIDSPFGRSAAAVVEIVFTALIFVVLAMTTKGYPVRSVAPPPG